MTTGVSSAQQAGLSYERWVGLAGVTGEVSELTSSSQFLAQPSVTEIITNSEAAGNVGENFGARVRGVVTAPLTGDYTFWVAGADGCELWLSSDASQFNRQKIAFVKSGSGVREWDRQVNQKSELVRLVAGQKYFIEVLQREVSGTDHVAVAWSYQSPDVKNWTQEAGAVATQSTTHSGGVAARAIDGNTNQSWAAGSMIHTANAANGWWQVDLGADRPVSRVDIWNRADGATNRLSNFRLSVLDASGQEVYGEDFYTTTGGSAGMFFAWYLPETVVGRVVKISQLGPNAAGNYFMHFSELQVWGDDAVAGNVAEGSPCPGWTQPGITEGDAEFRNTVAFPRSIITGQFLETYTTDPSDPDNDGLPTAYEQEHGLDPNSANDGGGGPFGDPDGDTIPNWLEVQLGTSPLKKSGKPGFVRDEFWSSMYHYATQDLVMDGRFYSGANTVKLLEVKEGELTGSGGGEYFGRRLRGHICPDQSGEFTFWLSAWTSAELWISTDETPWRKRKLASLSPEQGNNHGVRHGTANPWDVYVHQMSEPITLEAGKKYYFEIIQQQGHSGPPHATVAWACNEGARGVIPPDNLWSYGLREDDADDDSLPDAWETDHGLDPEDNGLVDRTRQGERGDYDSDGLNNRLEFVLGTDPANRDSDGDGMSDGDEYHSRGSDPTVDDSPTETVVDTVDINTWTSGSNWTSDGDKLVPSAFRGDVSWDFNVTESGVYLLHVGTRLYGDLRLSEQVEVEALVDGVSTGRRVIEYGVSRTALLRALTSHLSAGSHTLTLKVHNMLARRQVGVDSVTILRPGGADADADGIADWVAENLREKNRLTGWQAISAVSPAFIEGVSAQRNATVLNGSPVLAGTDQDHWYANLPLNPQGETPFSVEYPDAPTQTGATTWVETNVNEGGSLLIRKGDEMKLTARPVSGATGQSSGLWTSMETNWACQPGASASQSSTYTSGEAWRAIDGDTNGNRTVRNGVSITANQSGSWWQVDLGAERVVSSVVLWNRTDGWGSRLSNYRVSVLDAAGNTLVSEDFHTSGTATGTREQWNLTAPVTGRTVKVELLGPNNLNDHYLQLAEVQVFSTVNWASNPAASATQSSTSHSGIASRLIDGNTDGNWVMGSVAHTANAAGSWMEIDLGAEREISSVVVWPRTDVGYELLSGNYRASVLDDAGNTVISEDFYTSTGFIFGKEHWNFSQPVTGRKVRIERLEADHYYKYHYLSLAEIQVLGRTQIPLAADGDFSQMKFDVPGTYLIAGAHPAGDNDALSVTVRAADFSEETLHKFAGLVAGLRYVTEEADPRLWFDGGSELDISPTPTPATDGFAYLSVHGNGAGVNNLLARLYENGPVVGARPVNLIAVSDALQNDTTATFVSNDFPDYYLITTPIVVTNLPVGGKIVITIFRSGVTFADGTKQKTFYASDFANGVAYLDFLYPKNMTGGYCHYIDLYDAAGNYLGRR